MQIRRSQVIATMAITMGAFGVHAGTYTFEVDFNKNLYYTGLKPVALNHYNGYMMYSDNPADTPELQQRNRLGELKGRDIFYTIDEVYGDQPVMVELLPKTTVVDIELGGRIDHDGAFGFPWNTYNLPVRGPEGVASYLPENGYNNYSLIGIWAKDVKDLKNHVPSLEDPGFTPVGKEFHLVNALGGIYTGQLAVPEGAEYLLLGYNGHRRGFYHWNEDRTGSFSSGFYTVKMSNVTRPQDLPVPHIAVDRLMAEAPTSITFDASASTAINSIDANADDAAEAAQPAAAGAEIVRYHWDFGNGDTAEGAVVSRNYSEPGEYNVSLTVENSLGRTASTSVNVTIKKAGDVLTDNGGDDNDGDDNDGSRVVGDSSGTSGGGTNGPLFFAGMMIMAGLRRIFRSFNR